jgi:hypothetical protein
MAQIRKIISISRHTSRDCLCLIISRQQQFRLITVSQHHVPIIYSSISSRPRRGVILSHEDCACGGGGAHFKLLEKILTFAPASRALITDYLMSTDVTDFFLSHRKMFIRFSHRVFGDDCCTRISPGDLCWARN